MKLKSDIIVKLSEQQFDKIYDASLFLNGGNYTVDGKVDWVCGIGSLPRHFCNLVYIKNNSGYIVETKFGKGYTKHSDSMKNDKILVYLNDGRKIFCSPDKLKIIDFKD